MSAPRPEIRPAQAADFPAIVALVTASGLPASDLAATSLANFQVAASDGSLVGVAGVERAGAAGLLRSLAVAADFRSLGHARELVADCEALAAKQGLSGLYLIAKDERAANFFAHAGYAAVVRESVPLALEQLPEFTHLCPQSRPCLRKVFDSNLSKEAAMKKLEVFDPAMCCSTGVCGVDVDPALVQFAADLKWVQEQGVAVERHNLGQEPQAFAANPAVLKEMEAGMDRLPILAVDGHIVSTGMYPSRVQLAQKLNLSLPSPQTGKPHIAISAIGCKPGGGCC
jgi:N-acetylglutamate synthase-like GNAT family acetyltransferase